MAKDNQKVALGETETKLQKVERAMRAYFMVARTMGKTSAATPEEFYKFKASEVSELYVHMNGFGGGIWYWLNDDRVYDGTGEASAGIRELYAVDYPKPVKAAIKPERRGVKIRKRRASA